MKEWELNFFSITMSCILKLRAISFFKVACTLGFFNVWYGNGVLSCCVSHHLPVTHFSSHISNYCLQVYVPHSVSVLWEKLEAELTFLKRRELKRMLVGGLPVEDIQAVLT